jgi:formylglycine-generating enzyme required for sulfatase activity/uncharacterized caspase-like protein
MAKNWAICVGINQYDNLPPLNCAVRDAEAMRDYFTEVGFDQVYLFTDNSPAITDAGKPFNSQPSFGSLRRFLRVRFDNAFLSSGDNFWFFFSGHGMRHGEKDYLLPCDGDPHPEGIEETAIPLSYVSERLRRCGADNVVLLLDACRNEDSSKGIGLGEEEQQGVITFASCSPSERSYEIEALQQGSFTYALLEALRIQGAGNCATVERLEQRLRYRIPEINQAHRKPKQNPYAVVEPAFKYHLILLQNQATVKDVDTLKMRAYEAQNERNLVLAEQLWTRILAVSPADPQALKALQQIWTLPQPVQPLSKPRGDKSAKSSPSPPVPKSPISPVPKSLKRPQVSTSSLSENKVFVNRRKILSLGGQGILLIAGMAAIIPGILKLVSGMITASKKPSESQKPSEPQKPSQVISKLVNYQETLPGGIKLDMVTLPAGSFMMGSPASDPDASDREKPQHEVKLKSFSIGKYPITQEQYQAVMDDNPSHFKNKPENPVEAVMGDPALFKNLPKNPVENVSWDDAQKFCKQLSQLTGKKYCLPTEAEWEYACRAGTQTRFYFGDDAAKLGDYAWYSQNSDLKTHPVGEKKPNDWGLYDMSGNVWEWCEDPRHDNYANKPEKIKDNSNTIWLSSGTFFRVLRGGSWLHGSESCRSANRGWNRADVGGDDLGFRLAVSAF